MSDAEIYQLIIDNKDYFINHDIFAYILRAIQWSITTFLKTVVDQCENIYNLSFRFIDFTTWTGVSDFINEFKIIFVGILVVAVAGLGVMYVIDWEQKPGLMKITQNVLIGLLFLTCSTLFLNQLNDLLVIGTTAITSTYSGDGHSSNSVIRDNLYDLYYADSNYENGLADIASSGMPHYPDLTDDDIDMIDLKEIVDLDTDLKSSSKDILSKRITYVYGGSASGVMYLTDVSNDVLGIQLLGNGYYRYSFDFLTALLTFVAFIVIYIIMAYKVFKFILEIITGELLGFIHAANITNSQRIIKILTCIRDMYIMILFSAILIKVFLLIQEFLASTEPFSSNNFIRAVFILFAAFALADGPNIIEKLTGVDAGLSSGFSKLYAFSRAATAPLHLASGVTGMGLSLYQQHKVMKGMRDIADAMRDSLGNRPDMPDSSQNQSSGPESHSTNTQEDNSQGHSNNRSDNTADFQNNASDSSNKQTEMRDGLDTYATDSSAYDTDAAQRNEPTGAESSTYSDSIAMDQNVNDSNEEVTENNSTPLESPENLENRSPLQPGMEKSDGAKKEDSVSLTDKDLGNQPISDTAPPQHDSPLPPASPGSTIDGELSMRDSQMDDYVSKTIGDNTADTDVAKRNITTRYEGSLLSPDYTNEKDLRKGMEQNDSGRHSTEKNL